MGKKSMLRMFSVSYFLARKSIKNQKKTVLLTLFIIALGFLGSVIIPGILLDVTYSLQDMFIETYLGHVTIEPINKGEKIEDVELIKKKITSLPNVEAVVSTQSRVGRIYDSEGNYVDKEIVIINPEEFAAFSNIQDSIYEGEFLQKSTADGIILGCISVKKCAVTDVMGVIDVEAGETIEVLFNGKTTRDKITIKGIYGNGFQDTEQLIYITQRTAQQLFTDYNKDEADVIRVKLSDKDYTQQAVKDISSIGIRAKISDWEEKLAFMNDIVSSFNIIGGISSFIGILVAIVSVYIILYINILNRKVQIGIIKAIGVDLSIISTSYILQAFFYGVMGSLGGILLTLLAIFYFTIVPVSTPFGNLVPYVSTSLYITLSAIIIVASTITGYLASRKIIKQNILDSILK